MRLAEFLSVKHIIILKWFSFLLFFFFVAYFGNVMEIFDESRFSEALTILNFYSDSFKN